jgi:hypothetical protein
LDVDEDSPPSCARALPEDDAVMRNQAVHRVMYRAVAARGDVDKAVNKAVERSGYWSVSWALHWNVEGPVNRIGAVNRAADKAAEAKSPHPALSLYLAGLE